jgi:hypothetical protein
VVAATIAREEEKLNCTNKTRLRLGLGDKEGDGKEQAVAEFTLDIRAARFWGPGFMVGINDPLSDIGQRIQDRMSGIVQLIPPQILQPKISFATGGQVTTSERPVTNISVTINTKEQVDTRFVRRNIIPEIERYERLGR